MSDIDTATPSVAVGPAQPTPDDRRTRRRGWWAAGVLFGLAVLIGLTFVIPVQALGRITPGGELIDQGPVALRPGGATETSAHIAIEGAEVFEPDGEIRYTTVNVDDQVSIAEWVQAERSDVIELRTRDEVFGPLSTGETRERNLQLMQFSKDAAVLVALAELGIDVFDVTGVGFETVVEDGPAEGLLRVGDVIVAIDGSEVTDFTSLRTLLDQTAPGDTIVVTVEDNETLERRDVTLDLGVHPDGLEGGFVGIGGVIERVVQAELPFDVTIDSGNVGGPSAGLAFTLSILDLLTEGELTGGLDIAVTGDIRLDGSVQDVGGVTQKAAAARAAGADLFIVPDRESLEGRTVELAELGAGDMPVVGVTTLDEALVALAEYGGDTGDLALPEPVPAES